jgi:curved DNA-binding protein CbpA
MRNPYESLAVRRTATPGDIKTSYRHLAKRLHPDANKTDPDAAARFAELTAAHAILSDKIKRRAFDRGEIDAEGKPRYRPNRMGQYWNRLIIVMFMLSAASTWIILRSAPQIDGNASGRHVAPSRVVVKEEQIGAIQRGLQGDVQRDLPRDLATPASTDRSSIYPAGESPPVQEQTELVIARSEKLMSEGDVEAARALLEGADASHNPRAALVLGSTYDPIMLTILQARGVAADVSLARSWYRKASELGSQQAQERLDLLASARLTGAEQIAATPAEIAHNVDLRTSTKAAVTAIVPTKPRTHIVRLPTPARTARDEADAKPCPAHCLLDTAPAWLN